MGCKFSAKRAAIGLCRKNGRLPDRVTVPKVGGRSPESDRPWLPRTIPAEAAKAAPSADGTLVRSRRGDNVMATATRSRHVQRPRLLGTPWREAFRPAPSASGCAPVWGAPHTAFSHLVDPGIPGLGVPTLAAASEVPGMRRSCAYWGEGLPAGGQRYVFEGEDPDV